MADIQLKTVPSLMVLAIEGKGSKNDLFLDLAKIFEYLYENNLQAAIAGPGLGVLFSEFEPGKYLAAVPLKEKILPAGSQIRLLRLPEMECVFALHEGESQSVGGTLEELKRYFVKNGLELGVVRREVYWGLNQSNNPLTEVQLPLKISAAVTPVE